MTHPREHEPLDVALARLYRAAPDQFVATRKTLVSELRESDKNAAAEVAAAHKPTVTAWAVNQLALRHPDALEKFTDAVDALRTAQRHLLEAAAAKSADAKEHFANARAELNRRIGELQKIAREELAGIGVEWSPTTQRRITTTLNTVPLASAEDRDCVLRGRLVKDLEAIEDDSVLAVAVGAIDEKKFVARTHDHKERSAHESEARRQREKKEAEERAKRALDVDALRAEREAQRLEAEAERAEALAARARSAADAAKKKAADARRAALESK